MRAFYNEIDPFAAEWLRNLIAAGHIAPGIVDERSIVELDPDELRGFTECHFFAGIGVWSYALRLAGWPDDRPVWTGSAPCQPFSAAGSRRGHEDERHLWPAWHRLIRECRPATVFGEQVASRDGLAWLDLVLAGLEDDDYAVAAADLPAAGVGAPHIRQRLYFVAHDNRDGCAQLGEARLHGRRPGACGCESDSGNADGQLRDDASGCGEACGVAPGDAASSGPQRRGPAGRARPGRQGSAFERAGTASFWRGAEWIACRDGKARPAQPGIFPLAHGYSGPRVGILRAAGNALVAPLAAAFIRAADGA